MKKQEDIVLFVDPNIQDLMIQCVQKASPNEAFGLLFGFQEEVQNPEDPEDYFYHYTGQVFRCVESDKSSPVSFLMENEEKLNQVVLESLSALPDESDKTPRLISIFHSHPSGAYPSGIDKDHMRYLDAFSRQQSYVSKAFHNQIWTIMSAATKELNGFMYLQNKFIQIKVKIE